MKKSLYFLFPACLWTAFAGAALLSACSYSPAAQSQTPEGHDGGLSQPSLKSSHISETYQADLLAAPKSESPQFEMAEPKALSCTGIARQGGMVICQTRPGAKVKIGRSADDFYYEQADKNGQIIIGFDRDEKRAVIGTDGAADITYTFTPRDYDISRIDGLPPSQVSTFTPAQLKKIRASSARKKVGLASRSEIIGVENGFTYPFEGYIKTTNFGAQRILNGEPKKPHYGVDLAADKGTMIYAPADGLVSMADDDLYFEGALVLIDHGQGLISMYLHVNDILVEPGQFVTQGQPIATVGTKGRSTGPHLCWRLKWRNRYMDPELITHWPREAGVVIQD